MKIKTGQGNMTLQKLIAIYSISMVTSLPGLAISPILGKLESIFSSTSELQLQMLESTSPDIKFTGFWPCLQKKLRL